jgi:hypothetical protein
MMDIVDKAILVEGAREGQSFDFENITSELNPLVKKYMHYLSNKPNIFCLILLL